MKKGKDFMVFKYVYRSVDGVYMRDSLSDCIWLSTEFPFIDTIACTYDSFKLRMNRGLNVEITAWKDKHKNVIVRIIDKAIIQSKINF